MIEKTAVYVRYFRETSISVWTVGEEMKVAFIHGREQVEEVVKELTVTREELDEKRAVAVLTEMASEAYERLFGG